MFVVHGILELLASTCYSVSSKVSADAVDVGLFHVPHAFCRTHYESEMVGFSEFQ